MTSHASDPINGRQDLELHSAPEEKSGSRAAGDGGQLPLAFLPPVDVRPSNPFAPKLTPALRHAAVHMRSQGNSWDSVAQRFGVTPKSVKYLVGCGRYGGPAAPAPVSEVRVTSESSSDGVIDPEGRTPATGVDLIIRGLPQDNYRALQDHAHHAGWSVADFARELLACATPPSPVNPATAATAIRRVGLRHLVSTWRSEP